MLSPSTIDYTLLRPDATRGQLETICAQAAQHQFAAVCISPWMVERAVRLMTGTGVRVCTVLGFPLGYCTAETKEYEAKAMIALGATELDVVWNLQAFKSGDYGYIRNELADMMQITQRAGVILKVIIESGQLDERELRSAAQLCANAGVDFVKTSTGFNGPGAEIEKVRLLRQLLPPAIQIKASGGIRTAEAAAEFLVAGATRIGTSTLFAVNSKQ